MKKIIIFLLALLPVVAHADPSISSDAGRSIDNGQSNTIKRDKSLSADKSRGNRSTESDSRERVREGSTSKSHQERLGQSSEHSNSGSVDLNINSLLLKEFVAHYERQRPQPGMARVQQVFADCKPITGIVNEYPTLNSCPGGGGGGLEGTDTADIVPRRLATHFSTDACGQWGNDDTRSYQQRFSLDPANRVVGQYARCRIIASSWLAEAANRATTERARSEQEVRDRVQLVFSEMDADDRLFEKMRLDAADLWPSANCAPSLERYPEFQKPDIQCGIFTVEGNSITVENRETLSATSIAGRSYKIAINSSDSESVAVDDSTSADRRESYAERESDSRERFRESKKTASLNKSKSLDRNATSKVDRRAGSSMNAIPKE